MSLDFNGTTQYADFGNITDHGTISCWFKLDALTKTSGLMVAGEFYGPKASLDWEIYIHSTGALWFLATDGVAWAVSLTSDEGDVVAGTLYQAVVTVAGDGNTARLYLNAVEEDTFVQDGVITTTHTLYIPSNVFEATYGGADGVIFDARIYNRALSLAEIKSTHYAQGADNIVNGLIARWLMNEKPDGGTATVASSVIDISGNGNHGTPANSPVYRASLMRLVKSII